MALDKLWDSHISVIHWQKPALTHSCIKKTFCNALYFSGFKRSTFIIQYLVGQHFSKKKLEIELIFQVYWSVGKVAKHYSCLSCLLLSIAGPIVTDT